MYNMMFGQNAASDVILATLGLTTADVGRFRDCYVADRKIAVYTRNGGGNRGCWHEYDPKYGGPECKHHTISEPRPETVEVTEEEAAEKGYKLRNVWIGGLKRLAETGRVVDKTFYVCENPDSADCHCIGCFMTYHVHKLPYYSHDKDDDFDSTYATIYFDFPPEFADGLTAISTPASDLAAARGESGVEA